MTDAQQLFDYARNHINELADDVERHFNHVAERLRENFARTVPLPPVRRLPPPTNLQLVQRWILRHRRALTAAAIAFIITGTVGSWFYINHRQSKRKRRARRAPSGARTDVVIVAGAVTSPLASSLYLDLERRGFIVYVVSHTAEDEHYIRSLSRADLHPLSLDLLDPYNARYQLTRLTEHFTRSHSAFEGAEPHHLHLSGLILIPSLPTPNDTPTTLTNLTTQTWHDALHTRLLAPISVTTSLLPLLRTHASPVLLLTPSITPSIHPAGYAVQTTLYGALSGFAASLAAEVRGDGMSVRWFKLGALDVPALVGRARKEGGNGGVVGTVVGIGKATPVRRLNEAVFDALAGGRRRWGVGLGTVYVGRGARVYDLVARTVPQGWIAGLVGLMERRKGAMVGGGSGLVEREESLSGSAESLVAWDKLDEELEHGRETQLEM